MMDDTLEENILLIKRQWRRRLIKKMFSFLFAGLFELVMYHIAAYIMGGMYETSV